MNRGRAYFIIASLILLSFAQALAAPGDQNGQAPAESTDSTAADGASLKPAKKNPYKKSKVTNDESEMTADKRKLLLATGEDKAVDLEFEPDTSQRVSIGNPTIVTTMFVKLGEKRQIVFKPLKKGTTTVTIRDNEGTIRVIFTVTIADSNLLRMAGEIRDLLRDVEGINIRIVGQKVIIEGELLVPADLGRMLSVIQDGTYKAFVINLTTLSPLALDVLAKRIQEDINTFAPNVRTRVVNSVIFLEGTVDSKPIADRAERVAVIYLPEVKPGNPAELVGEINPKTKPPQFSSLIQNFIVINPPPPKKQERLVRVTVHFVELDKDYEDQFGFKWSPGFTANPSISVGTSQTGSPTAGGASFAGTIGSLFPKLTSAQTAGFARVLKTGTIVVRSGQPASLQEFEQIPISVPGPQGPVPQNQNVGLEFGVTPSIVGQSEDIQLDLKMDQINLVSRGPAGATSTHKVETRLYIKSNESAAVAGVNSSDVGTDFNADPSPGIFDAGTDPLFKLIHSKDYTKKKSEFVIFVTPQIVESASEGTEDLKKNFRIRVK